MSSQGITITVNAETAQAAQKFTQLFSGLNQGFTQLSGFAAAFQNMWKVTAAAVTVTSIAGFTRSAINSMEAMGKLSEKTGVAVTTLNALKEQAERAGTPFEELSQTIGIFSDKLYTAVRQGGQSAQVFRDLGIKLTDAAGNLRSVDAVLADVAEAFKGMADGPQKAAAAMGLFGRSGREMIPILNRGAAEMERMRREGGGVTPEAVAEAKRFNQSVREFTESWDIFWRLVAQSVLPTLNKVGEWFKTLAEDAATAGANVQLFAETFALHITKGALTGFVDLARVLGELFIRLSGTVAKAFDSALASVLNKFIDRANYAMSFLSGATGGKFPMGVIGSVSKSNIDKQVADEIKALNEGAEILKEPIAATFDRGIEAIKAKAGQIAAIRKAVELSMSALQTVFGTFGSSSSRSALVPVSEEAKKLIADIDRQFAEATKGKIALLDMEEAELKKKVDQEVLDVRKAEEEKAKITETFAVKRKEILQKEEDTKREIELAAVQAHRELLSKDPDFTAVEKKGRLLELMRAENRLLEQNIELKRRQASDPKASDEARLQAVQQLQQLELKRAQLQQEMSRTSAGGTFSGEFRRVTTELGDQWGSWAQQMANGFREVFNSAISSVSQGITGLIMGTKNWRQALAGIGETILTTVVQAIVQMGVQWVATKLLMLATDRAVATATTAMNAQSGATGAVAGVGQAGAQGGWVGILIYMAVLAAAIAAVAAMMGGFEEGGWTGPGSNSQVAGLVHANEFVFSAPAVNRIGKGNLEELHSSGRMGGAGGGGRTQIAVSVTDDRRAKDLAADPSFEGIVMRVFDKHRWRYK